MKSKEKPLHVKYRPTLLEDILGHEEAVESIGGFLESGKFPHSFLFSGPSGVGKTTFARIIGEMLSAEIIEVDAATYSGVDQVRGLTGAARFRPLDSKKPHRLYIIDECHALSKQAWQALLKITEEPPDYVSFVLCTTEVSKVPKQIKTRCAHYDLKPISENELAELIEYVTEEEELEIEEDRINAIVEASEGSPRQALVFLEMSLNVDDSGLRKLLAQPGQDPEVIQFCRGLLKGSLSWADAMAYVKAFEKQYPAETVRIIVLSYFQKVVMGSKSPPDNALKVLDCFSDEWPQTDRYAPMLLALAEILM